MPWILPSVFRGRRRALDSLDDAEEQGMLNYSETELSGLPQLPGKEKQTKAIHAFLATIYRIALICLPSFAHRRNESGTENRRDQSRMSSLDGLRGYAALAVMNYHIFYAYQPFVFYGYGLSPTAAAQCARPGERNEDNLWFHQLPFLRLIYTGTWSISVFFVISGFALSYKALRESRNSDGGFTKACAAVASSLIRRPFRLLLPPITATLITMVAIQLGAYEHGRQISRNSGWVPIINEVHQKRFDTFAPQLLNWCHETSKLFDIFWWGDRHNQYDVHLWTIPTELRCSLAIFLILPMYITLRQSVRRPLMFGLILFVYALDRWDVALFYAGLLIADTSLSREPGKTSSISSHGYRRLFFQSIHVGLFILSFMLLSAPDFCIGDTPGFSLVSKLIPSSDPAPFRFIPNIGGILLVTLISHTDPANAFVSASFDSSFPQYLGRISYGLYIVHGPLIHAAGYAVFQFFWRLTGREERWRYVTGFVAAYVVLVTVIVLVADMFWMVVDKYCIKVAKAFEDRVTS